VSAEESSPIQEFSSKEPSSKESSLHVSRSAERALQLLDAVITNGGLSLGEAAGMVDIPVSTALRHLRGLEAQGFLDRDEHGVFAVGPTFVRLALTTLTDGWVSRLIEVARPHLEALVEITGETAYLAIRDKDHATYVTSVETTRAIRHVGWTGRSVPLSGTAVGAALCEQPVERESDIPTHVNTGAAEPDVTAVSSPVYGRDGSVVAAISVLGPAHRLEGARLSAATAAVAAAAAAVGRDLGADSMVDSDAVE
jgi:DNA-binding IclR family transcriptional regulator